MNASELDKKIRHMREVMKEKKRKMVQLVSAILYNCNVGGFRKGDIYQGDLKRVCVPGLNCYSCPGSIGSCPLGSLQTALLSVKYKFPYYILGLLLLFGILFGRMICGFLCPFGWFQELLYLIPTPKMRKNRVTHTLSYAKYVIFAIFAIAIPLLYAVPGFCKYICPAGTLEGGIPLVLLEKRLRGLIGVLFSWKVAVLILVIGGSVFVFRAFCRFLCPLGAFYSLFHGVSFLGVCVDEDKCTGCRQCVANCKMDVKQVGDRECIQCGECRKECPHSAIRYKKLKK